MLRCAGRRLLSVAAAARTPSPDVLNVAQAQENKLDDLSPRRITDILDKYIVGQSSGKKAVAISLRNRWRRRQIADADLQKEVMPKNILLIGPTGVGKTEISRRMARLTDAPFVKVDATKYTEVGFRGKDVEGIIEDLYTNAKSKAKLALGVERHEEALSMTLDSIYSSWIVKRRAMAAQTAAKATTAAEAFSPTSEGTEKPKGKKRRTSKKDKAATAAADSAEAKEVDPSSSSAAPSTVDTFTLEYFRAHYADEFKDDMVTIELTAPQQAPNHPSGVEIPSMGVLLGFSAGYPPPKKMVVTKKVVEAVPLVLQESLAKLIDENSINGLARTLAEEDGVVFIDEIDKVVVDPEGKGDSGDVSSTGVQQDLLPLVEGTNVTMKDGSVISTDNILFICSGAFHVAKTSHMIAELQGRLPVRVELQPLTEKDFRRILTEPKFNLLLQQKEMLKTENIDVEFTEDGISRLANVTCQINNQGQNIGARRLNTILEKVMDEYSFNCEDYEGKKVLIDAKSVDAATEKLMKNVNLAKYLL